MDQLVDLSEVQGLWLGCRWREDCWERYRLQEVLEELALK